MNLIEKTGFVLLAAVIAAGTFFAGMVGAMAWAGVF